MWPGVLAVLGALAVLALVGVGPFVWLGVAGIVAASRLPRLEGAAVAMALLWVGLCVGPGLDVVSRSAVIVSREDPLGPVWRLDRTQPLPGDIDAVQVALARRPDDAMLRAAAATHHLRLGELDVVETLVSHVPSSSPESLRAHALGQLGAVRLARGDVRHALSAFEEARHHGESAAVLYNLSQAYGRAIRLPEQSSLFTAARELDPELVSERSSVESRSLHGYLIRSPLPLGAFLREAFAPSREAAALAGSLRERVLPPAFPDWVWIVPGLGVIVAVLLRRSEVRRCVRCGRQVCERCSPGVEGETCLRCVHLFVRSIQIDARVRRRELTLDRRRQVRSDVVAAATGLVLPGVGALLDGRPIAGGIRAALWGLGSGLVLVPWTVPAPWEVGGLGTVLPLGLGVLLLAPSYLAAAAESARRVAPWRAAP
jgi:hypothetical protein